jgi:large subunit ribosomal protein L10
MDRSQKEQFLEELRGIFSTSTSGVLVDYQGMSAAEVVELRQKLYEVSSSMKVLKNTLARLAAEDTAFAELSNQFVQTRALIYSDTDPVGQAKVVAEFAKTHSKLQVLAGLLADENKVSVLSDTEVEALSKLPSKEELLVQLLFLMQAPATQFVRTLNEVPAKFVRVLSAIAESKN